MCKDKINNSATSKTSDNIGFVSGHVQPKATFPVSPVELPLLFDVLFCLDPALQKFIILLLVTKGGLEH